MPVYVISYHYTDDLGNLQRWITHFRTDPASETIEDRIGRGGLRIPLHSTIDSIEANEEVTDPPIFLREASKIANSSMVLED